MRTVADVSSVPDCRLEISRAVSEKRAPDASRASSFSLVAASSMRPRVASTRWRVAVPSRVFSTSCG